MGNVTCLEFLKNFSFFLTKTDRRILLQKLLQHAAQLNGVLSSNVKIIAF